ncbi:MAG TPA: UDP-N-acetylmuramate dehydrogenase [Spirochaetota bacterium]|nr:UDP-N-acetylmuramate dehydrogenase [Spirochaetota bacterium]
MRPLKERLYETFSDIKADVSLAPYTSFKAGGRALFFLETGREEDIITLFKLQEEIPFTIGFLGKGTNLLINDTVINKVVVRYQPQDPVTFADNNRVIIKSGCLLQEALHLCLSNNRAGLEGAAGIPGTVGGAVCMNASSGLGYVTSCLEGVNIITGHDCGFRTKEELALTYRSSNIRPDEFIASAVFELPEVDDKAVSVIRQKIKKHLQQRRSRQPLSCPSFGSVFKNPPGHSAGELIEKAGLKGVSLGDVQIATRHANFIINKGRGQARQAYELIQLAAKKVWQHSGIRLQREVVLWGFSDSDSKAMIL